jgi:hypothetical protein
MFWMENTAESSQNFPQIVQLLKGKSLMLHICSHAAEITLLAELTAL